MFYFGAKLREWRKARNITIYKVSREAGVNRANLSSLELGKRPASDDVIERLASVKELELSITRLKVWKRLNGITQDELECLLICLETL